MARTKASEQAKRRRLGGAAMAPESPVPHIGEETTSSDEEADEPKAEEPKAEEPRAESPKADEEADDEPKAEDAPPPLGLAPRASERCVECWRWLLLHPHFQCPGCFGMIHARCAAQHAMRHQQEDGMARAPQGRGAQGRGAQD